MRLTHTAMPRGKGHLLPSIHTSSHSIISPCLLPRAGNSVRRGSWSSHCCCCWWWWWWCCWCRHCVWRDVEACQEFCGVHSSSGPVGGSQASVSLGHLVLTRTFPPSLLQPPWPLGRAGSWSPGPGRGWRGRVGLLALRLALGREGGCHAPSVPSSRGHHPK